NSLIRPAEGVDRGALIDQGPLSIPPYDPGPSLHDQVATSNRDMPPRLPPRLLAGERPGRPQPASEHPELPRRRPADGLIDWSRPSREVYDFIRALTRPYPGAFSWLDGTRWTVWQAALLLSGNGTTAPVEPGTVLGPLVSPVAEACGQMVACGEEEDGGKGVV